MQKEAAAAADRNVIS